MNKAFVREPDDDGRAYCPRCNSLGAPVGAAISTRLHGSLIVRLLATALCLVGLRLLARMF